MMQDTSVFLAHIEYLYQVVAIDGGSLIPSNWMCAMSGPAGILYWGTI